MANLCQLPPFRVLLGRPHSVFNTTNAHSRRPFHVDGNGHARVLASDAWLVPFLRQAGGAATVDIVQTRDELHAAPAFNDVEWRVYKAVNASYSLRPDTWARWHWAGERLTLVPVARTRLKDMLKVGLLRARPLGEDDIDEAFTGAQLRALHDAVRACDGKAFVKISCKSPKKGMGGLRPIVTVVDMVNYLCSSPELVWLADAEGSDEQEYIAVSPWLEFERQDEWRVFVHGGEVVAISQQHCYTSYGERAVDADVELILFWWRALVPRPYQCATLDLVVTAHPASGLRAVHLIEFNPPTDWGSSGSSLFNWTEDAMDAQCVPVRIF